MKFVANSLLSVFCLLVRASAVPKINLKRETPTPGQVPDVYYFSTLTASSTLKWVPCYSDLYQCTRLEVPLKYNDPNGEKT